MSWKVRWPRPAGDIAAAMLLGFLIYPYVTLYRIGAALGEGNARVLAQLIDWDAVRDGIKEDICDAVTETPTRMIAANNTLPPFGFSFVREIAGNAIDANVSPGSLVAAIQATRPAFGTEQEMLGLRYAFFDGPRRFTVLYHTAGQHPGEPDLRLQLELRHFTWKVTRAWLSPNLLMAANTHS